VKPVKIVSIVGARPQFIKSAAVSRVLRALPGAEEILVHTGQHYDRNMSDVFFSELDIPTPEINLGIGSGTHGEQTARMLEAIEQVLIRHRPDAVVIYGDTNSTLAGALAAAKLHVPVAHVEAGLRSFNKRMPEEINRIVADHCADLLLVPTEAGVRNLRNEGVAECKIRLVGDVMYDAALYYASRARASSTILATLGLAPHDYVLCTVHRAENTDDPHRLAAIFDALVEVSRRLPVVLPLHPRTRAALAKLGLDERAGARLRIIAPVGYLDMVILESNARLIATDSGGVQKEAYFHSVPCATLRDETEWVELVEAGWNTLLAPTGAANIASGLARLLDGVDAARAHPSFYGEGDSAQKIVAAVRSLVHDKLAA
jgi:UDP-GlcNAc3NAcA epimerase